MYVVTIYKYPRYLKNKKGDGFYGPQCISIFRHSIARFMPELCTLTSILKTAVQMFNLHRFSVIFPLDE